MPEKNLDEVLGQFNNDDYTVKLCSTIFGVIPGTPDFAFYNNLEGAVQRLAGGDQSWTL